MEDACLAGGNRALDDALISEKCSDAAVEWPLKLDEAETAVVGSLHSAAWVEASCELALALQQESNSDFWRRHFSAELKERSSRTGLVT
jgi:hypothetical protein